MARRTIHFYFDYISPYAYLAWKRIHPLADRVGYGVEPIPILFAALLDAWQKGPAEIPPKREWTFRDVSRRAHALGVPLVPPPAHPFNPLPALRVTAAAENAAERRRIIDALFDATWGGGGGGGGIDGLGRVEEVLRAAGLDAARLAREAGTAEIKEKVRALTEEARAAGAFGVPTMILDGELFWGDDALPQVEAFARGEDSLDRGAMDRWRSLPSAAQRKQ